MVIFRNHLTPNISFSRPPVPPTADITLPPTPRLRPIPSIPTWADFDQWQPKVRRDIASPLYAIVLTVVMFVDDWLYRLEPARFSGFLLGGATTAATAQAMREYEEDVCGLSLSVCSFCSLLCLLPFSLGLNLRVHGDDL